MFFNSPYFKETRRPWSPWWQMNKKPCFIQGKRASGEPPQADAPHPINPKDCPYFKETRRRCTGVLRGALTKKDGQDFSLFHFKTFLDVFYIAYNKNDIIKIQHCIGHRNAHLTIAFQRDYVYIVFPSYVKIRNAFSIPF